MAEGKLQAARTPSTAKKAPLSSLFGSPGRMWRGSRAAGAPSASAPVPRRGLAPAHGFRPWKAFWIAAGKTSTKTSIVAFALMRHDGDIEFGLFGIPLILASASDLRPALFKKPCTAASGAPTRGPRFPSRVSGCRAGRPAMCNASRLGVAKLAAPSCEEAASRKRFGDEPAEILAPPAPACGRGFPRKKARAKGRASWRFNTARSSATLVERATAGLV